MLVNVKKGRVIGEYEISGVPSFSNPAWSPVDDKVVVSGMVEGRNSFICTIWKTKQTTNLPMIFFIHGSPIGHQTANTWPLQLTDLLKEGSPITPKGGTNLGIINLEPKRWSWSMLFRCKKTLTLCFHQIINRFSSCRIAMVSVIFTDIPLIQPGFIKWLNILPVLPVLPNIRLP